MSSSFQQILQKTPSPERYPSDSPVFWKVACALTALPRGGGAIANLIGRKLIGNHRFQIDVPGDAKLAVEPANLAYYALLHEGRAKGQEEIANRCLSLLTEEDIFYDIGANAGYISSVCGTKAKFVASFEPQPVLARATAASLRINEMRESRVFRTLLGKEQGELTLHVPNYGIHASLRARQSGARKLLCPVHPLDAIVASGIIPPPTLVKIDVEGAELDVFKGSAKTISLHQPTILFEADENLKRFGLTRSDLTDYLASLARYEFRALTSNGLVPLDDPSARNATDLIASVRFSELDLSAFSIEARA